MRTTKVIEAKEKNTIKLLFSIRFIRAIAIVVRSAVVAAAGFVVLGGGMGGAIVCGGGLNVDLVCCGGGSGSGVVLGVTVCSILILTVTVVSNRVEGPSHFLEHFGDSIASLSNNVPCEKGTC